MPKNTDEKIIVHIDPELKDLIPEYLANRNKDIESITDALGKGDYTLIKTLGHSMRGSGGGYGFDAITDIGRSLEQAAKNKNSKEVQEHVSELKGYLECIEVVYG